MLLDAKKIINAIQSARQKHRKGELKDNIKNAVPSSFWEIDEKSSEINKQKLIEMGKRGEARPQPNKHPLGIVLKNYIRKGYSGYDPIFDKKIRKVATHWFIDRAETNKEKLLEMATRGEPKPKSLKHPLGDNFNSYIRKGSGAYDPVFDKKIRKIAPHWFVKQAEINKQKLLEMARKGEPKPIQTKHPLGDNFKSYIGRHSSAYDPVFTQKISKLAPHWFKK